MSNSNSDNSDILRIDLREEKNKNFPILEWVLLEDSTRPDCQKIGVLSPSFTTQFKLQDENTNDFFWKECISCMAYYHNTCAGGRNTYCKQGFSPSRYTQSKMVDLVHPPLLSFSDPFNKVRYNYFALREASSLPKNPTLVESFEYLPYVRTNTYSSGKVCLGTLGFSKRINTIWDLIYFEFLHSSPNEDLFYYEEIAEYEDLLLRFLDYKEDLISFEDEDGDINPNDLIPRTISSMKIRENGAFYMDSWSTSISVFSPQEFPVLEIDYENKTINLLEN